MCVRDLSSRFYCCCHGCRSVTETKKKFEEKHAKAEVLRNKMMKERAERILSTLLKREELLRRARITLLDL